MSVIFAIEITQRWSQISSSKMVSLPQHKTSSCYVSLWSHALHVFQVKTAHKKPGKPNTENKGAWWNLPSIPIRLGTSVYKIHKIAKWPPKKKLPQRENTDTFFKQVWQFNKDNTILWPTKPGKIQVWTGEYRIRLLIQVLLSAFDRLKWKIQLASHG